MSEKLSEETLLIARHLTVARVQDLLLGMMLRASNSGYSMDIFDKRLGWKPGKITEKVYSGDISLDDLSDIARAFCCKPIYGTESIGTVDYDFKKQAKKTP